MLTFDALMDITIRVLVYEPGKAGELREVPDTLVALQELVGGFFEIVLDDAANLHMLVNDDADDLPVNRRFGQHLIRGTAVFSRSDGRGQTSGVSDEDVARLRALYG